MVPQLTSLPQIEQWYEHQYPSFASVSSASGQLTLDMSDVRTRVVEAEKKKVIERQAQRKVEALRNAQAVPMDPSEDMSTRELFMFVGGGLSLVEHVHRLGHYHLCFMNTSFFSSHIGSSS